MKKLFQNKVSSIVLATVVAFIATGCTHKYSAGVSNVDIGKTDMKELEELKTGEACAARLLFILPLSLDATARKAAKEADISKIKYQEVSHTDYLLYRSSCVKVYGY
jgi:hypothetical protein